MEIPLQRVLNHKILDLPRNYILSLLLTRGKKNCSSMARELGKTSEKYRIYLKKTELQQNLENILYQNAVKMINSNKKNEWYLIVDDTFISKQYSRFIELAAYGWDGCSKRCCVGLSIVVVAITNGNVNLPVAFKSWNNLKKGTSEHKTKSEIAIKMLHQLKLKLGIKKVIFDGAYCSKKAMTKLDEMGFLFTCKFARNRVIQTADGRKTQIQKHPKLKLKRNQRKKIICAHHKDRRLFFVANKRRKKHGGNEIYFIAQNYWLEPGEIVKTYEKRWGIEKIFRTTKQSFGLKDCQCLDWEKQESHIAACFLAYSEIVKNYCKIAIPVEKVLGHLRFQKHGSKVPGSLDWENTLMN